MSNRQRRDDDTRLCEALRRGDVREAQRLVDDEHVRVGTREFDAAIHSGSTRALRFVEQHTSSLTTSLTPSLPSTSRMQTTAECAAHNDDVVVKQSTPAQQALRRATRRAEKAAAASHRSKTTSVHVVDDPSSSSSRRRSPPPPPSSSDDTAPSSSNPASSASRRKGDDERLRDDLGDVLAAALSSVPTAHDGTRAPLHGSIRLVDARLPPTSSSSSSPSTSLPSFSAPLTSPPLPSTLASAASAFDYTLAWHTTSLDDFGGPRSPGIGIVLVGRRSRAEWIDVQRELAFVARVVAFDAPPTATPLLVAERVATLVQALFGEHERVALVADRWSAPALVHAVTRFGVRAAALVLDTPVRNDEWTSTLAGVSPASHRERAQYRARSLHNELGVDYAAVTRTPVVILARDVFIAQHNAGIAQRKDSIAQRNDGIAQHNDNDARAATYEWRLAFAAAPLLWIQSVAADDDALVVATIDALASLYGYGARTVARGVARALANDDDMPPGLAQFYVGRDRRPATARTVKRVADALFEISYEDAATVAFSAGDDDVNNDDADTPRD